ncbi:gluconokinase [Paenarthrobacter ureafaciens]|uniref:gluconokinase n=1 Tax=Paenarthrobacter ureafaciens TaxID=37931 RepID=UPI00140E0B42|nr:gluconokinase [Paenarthrobacter ureafaciens]MCX8452516.1 gluconokinase [Paenarthrobacter ureafaciens]MCY0971154.1 gluconokinase [Paenarthrobacter ureafaciens]
MAKTAQQPVLVIMGVSGSGKSTVAGVLAGKLCWDLAEGDDLHPEANVAKMHAGQALTDEDRWPWLGTIADWIKAHTAAGTPAIITCSALKKKYRDVLRGEGVVFVFLQGSKDRISDRLASRHGHFMPASLLESQFEALEEPTEDENYVSLCVSASPAEEADEVIERLGLHPVGAGAG